MISTMTEEVTQPPASTPKGKAPKQKRKSTNSQSKKTPYSDMIMTAVTVLKKRKGTSRQAILKYMKVKYEVGGEAGAHFKSVLKGLVENKQLVQVKGNGALGSFKLNKKVGKAKKPVQKVAKKTPTKKKPTPKKTVVKPAPKRDVKAKPASKKAADPKKNQNKSNKSTTKKVAPKTKKVAAGKKGNVPRRSPVKKAVKKVVSKSKNATAAKT